MAESSAGRAHVLPDVLGPGLDVVFCGSAAGTKSAEAGAYYAGSGNRFWPTLCEVGLTPRELRPEEFGKVLKYGIGLTDLCKFESGRDSPRIRRCYDMPRLVAEIKKFAPRVLAFNGITAAKAFAEHHEWPFTGRGMLKHRIGNSEIFALPSTSGRNKHWDEGRPWRELAAHLGRSPA